MSPVGGAGIQFVLAVPASVWQLTHALVVVHQVYAGAAVLARIHSTIIHIRLTVGASVAWQTLA